MTRAGVRRAVLAAAVASAVGGCSKPARNEPPAAAQPGPREPAAGSTAIAAPGATQAQLDRRQRSIAAVKAMGLPWSDQLPVIEDEARIQPRTVDEVASRCLATGFCALKGEENDQALVDHLVEEYAASGMFSPKERAFLRDPSPAKQVLTDFAWRYECVHVFLWALGYLPALNPPSQPAEVGKEVGIIRDQGRTEFANRARLRPLREILEQADLYYRLHWAASELRRKGTASDKVDEEIVVERHRALNWLIRHLDQAWDDVTTDP
jgi:hypothetical protein